MKKLVILLLVLIPTFSCGDSVVSPSPPVNIVFTLSPNPIPVGTIGTFHIQSNANSGCFIAPSIGDVPCNGSKDWAFSSVGTFTFTLYISNVAQQSVVAIVK